MMLKVAFMLSERANMLSHAPSWLSEQASTLSQHLPWLSEHAFTLRHAHVAE